MSDGHAHAPPPNMAPSTRPPVDSSLDQSRAPEPAPQKNPNAFLMLFDWRIDSLYLRQQVELYGTLPWWRSRRKQSAALLSASLLVTLIILPASGAAVTAVTIIHGVLIAVLAIFAYRGHRWSFVVSMIWWTIVRGQYVVALIQEFFEQGVQRWSGIGIQVIFWAFFMGTFWHAFRIEQERRKNRSVRG